MNLYFFLTSTWILFRIIECKDIFAAEVLIGYFQTYKHQQSVSSKSKNSTNDELYSISIEAEYQYMRTDECWVPYSSIIITCSNEYHFPLVLLQIEGLKARGLWHCLKSNYHGK